MPLVKEIDSHSPETAAAVQTTELSNRRWLSKNVFEIELTRPKSFDFEAGQTICFRHESLKRYYSLLSAPDHASFELCVHYVPKGHFSPILADAEIGSQFKFTGPHGYFTYRRSARQAVFVASGTGVAPFVSMGRAGVTDFILLHEVLSAEDLYYQKIFRKIASNYVPCFLEESPADQEPSGTFQGNAARFIKKNLTPATYDFYLCGEREMIREVTLLVDERFAGSRVYTEVFY
jgi:ferredoxin-NADP reductase